MATAQLRIRVDEDADLKTAKSLAADHPSIDIKESMGPSSLDFEGQVEPITAILVGAGVAALAKFVTDWWEKRRGGLVLDQRPHADDEIYRDQDVPYGYVLVYPPDGGMVKVETKDMPKDAIQQLLESLIGGATKSFGNVSKVAKELVGAEKVEESPAAGG